MPTTDGDSSVTAQPADAKREVRAVDSKDYGATMRNHDWASSAPESTVAPEPDGVETGPDGTHRVARHSTRAGEPEGTRRHAVLANLRSATPAILGYAGLRLFGMIVLFLWARHIHADFTNLFNKFDMSWYASIAQHGYDRAITFAPNGHPNTTNLAFFPLFPAMIRAVVAVLPVSYITAGLLLDWVFSLVAAWGLFAVGKHLYDRRVGIVLALLWAVLPYAIDETLGLTESLFTAFAAWCLYALLTRRWLTAGIVCLVAGLGRPTADALIAAVGIAALIALVRREGPWWRPVLAAVIAPLGWVAYLVWVALRLHRADGWFYVQGQIWKSSFDGGRYSLHMVRDTLLGKGTTIEPYVVTLFLAVVVVAFVLSILERQPVPLLVYSAVLFVSTVGGTGYYHTDPRHLLPAFPLLLPLALGTARMRLRNAVALVTVMAFVAAWYGGYLALIWKFSY